MSSRIRHLLLGWLVVTTAGCVVGSHLALERLRTAFESEAQLAYLALSQEIREHQRLVETLALLQPASAMPARDESGSPLGRLYPAVKKVLRSDDAARWPADAGGWLAAAQARSQRGARSAVAQLDLAEGSFWIVRAGQPVDFALQIDLRQLASRAVQETLSGRSEAWAWIEHAGARRIVQAGAAPIDDGAGWRLGFRRRLELGDLPVDFVAQRRVDWLALPWTGLAAWFLATSIAALVLAAWWRGAAARRPRRPQPAGQLTWKAGTPAGRSARTRAAEDVPAAVSLVPTPAAAQRPPLFVTLREVDAEPPELVVARGAIRDAARQSRRTAEAIARLRRSVERPDVPGSSQRVDGEELLRDALELIEPDCERLGVGTALVTDDASRLLLADPIALEQIVHHLLSRALHALERVAAGERRIELTLAVLDETRVVLGVRDTGARIAPEDVAQLTGASVAALPREAPLARCAALARRMGGSLAVAQATPGGTLFRLTLPRAA